jgi:hypothetical protein
MKKPATKTMFFGHPVIAVPMMLVGAATLAAAFYGGNFVVGIIGVAVLGAAQKAYGEAKVYKAWKLEWDGMAPGGCAPVRKRGWRFWATVVFGVIWFGLACAGGQNPYDAMVGTAGFAVALVIATAAFRFARRSRRPSAKSAVVAVVARPAMPTLSLTDAYRALPPYCHVLMGGK